MMKFVVVFALLFLSVEAFSPDLDNFDIDDLEIGTSSEFNDAMLQATTLLSEGGSSESIKKMLGLLNELLAKLRAEKAALLKEKADAEAAIRKAKAVVKDLEEKLLKQRAVCAGLSKQYEELSNKLVKLKAELKLAEAALAAAKKEALEIANIKKEIALIKEILQLVNDAEGVGAGTNELQTKYEQISSRLVQLSPAYKPANIMELDEGRKHAELSGVRTLLKEMLDMLQQQISQLNNAVSSSQAEVDRLEKLIANLRKELKALALKLEECKLALKELNKALAVAKGKLTELERLYKSSSKEWADQIAIIDKEIALINEIVGKVKQLKPSSE